MWRERTAIVPGRAVLVSNEIQRQFVIEAKGLSSSCTRRDFGHILAGWEREFPTPRRLQGIEFLCVLLRGSRLVERTEFHIRIFSCSRLRRCRPPKFFPARRTYRSVAE